jgi:hypothetical protein
MFDWDGTLTMKETMDFIGKIVETQPASSATWEDVVMHYMDHHYKHAELYEPKKAERKTVVEEREWLQSLRPIETSSARKAEEIGIFKGVTAIDIQNVARKAIAEGEVQIRDGWRELLAEIDFRQKTQTPQNHDMVSIVSANWSQLFILECLKASKCPMDLSIPSEPGEPRSGLPHTIRIYANEIQGIHLEEGSSGLLTHPNGRDFRTSDDKSKWISDCVEAKAREIEPPVMIYFGDSMGDFDALLDADLGVCLRNNPPSRAQQGLLDTFERLGLRVPHISETGQNESDSIVWASNFQEVLQVLQTS